MNCDGHLVFFSFKLILKVGLEIILSVALGRSFPRKVISEMMEVIYSEKLARRDRLASYQAAYIKLIYFKDVLLFKVGTICFDCASFLILLTLVRLLKIDYTSFLQYLESGLSLGFTCA